MLPTPSSNCNFTSLCYRLWGQWRQGSYGASSSGPGWASTNPSDAGRASLCGSRQPGLLQDSLHGICRVWPTGTHRFFTPPLLELIMLIGFCCCRFYNLFIPVCWQEATPSRRILKMAWGSTWRRPWSSASPGEPTHVFLVLWCKVLILFAICSVGNGKASKIDCSKDSK